jgi:hypothetical protein
MYKLLVGGLILSLSTLNTHFRYERDLFEAEALGRNDLGEAYRRGYMEERPESPTAVQFR